MLTEQIDAHRLETLIEINALINSNYTDHKILLTRILESATRLSNGEASSLLLLNPENNRLYFEIALGTKGNAVQKFSLELGEGIAGWVAKNNTSLIVNDVDQDKRFKADISRQIGFSTNSILAVPMRLKDYCVGVIEIINKTDGQIFNQIDLQWLEIFATQAAIAIQNAQIYQKATDEIYLLKDQVLMKKGFHTLINKSNIIRDQLEMVKRIAKTDSSVLILGESGVGKELFAEQIHLNSDRADQPFIRVNCAALPEHLLESELFGHVKGAFTDAVNDRRGRFELADGGTIFLDEIGDMPVNLQVKLLRVLQHKMFEKVGASKPIQVDIRIVAATNKNLDKAIEKGQFRKDLYYRLNVFPLKIPPLRERADDIPALVDFFLKKFNREVKKQIRGLTDEAMETLLSYAWPGNVRELENVIERAVVICKDSDISTKDLILTTNDDSMEHYAGKKLKEAITVFKKHFIEKIFEQHNWNQTETAKRLGIQRTYLSKLIKELQIKTGDSHAKT